jgi:hypothetical protein
MILVSGGKRKRLPFESAAAFFSFGKKACEQQV